MTNTLKRIINSNKRIKREDIIIKIKRNSEDIYCISHNIHVEANDILGVSIGEKINIYT